MEMHVYRDVQQLARGAADAIATELDWSIQHRGIATIAVSGGATPWLMLTALARHPIRWEHVHVFQVDERCAPDGHADRSATRLHETLLDVVAIPVANAHLIDFSAGIDSAAARYAAVVEAITGGTFDVVHLGLGDDGHTASLVPGDPALDIEDSPVAVSNTYRGYQRVTLTYPVLNSARRILWLTNGAEKIRPLQLLRAADRSIPAGRVDQQRAVLYCDEAAVSSGDSRE